MTFRILCCAGVGMYCIGLGVACIPSGGFSVSARLQLDVGTFTILASPLKTKLNYWRLSAVMKDCTHLSYASPYTAHSYGFLCELRHNAPDKPGTPELV